MITKPLVFAGLKRAVLIGLLVLAYVGAWRPARSWLAHQVLYPAFSSIETERADEYRLRKAPLGVAAHSTDRRTRRFRVPVGILFLLPALILVLLFPDRPYWLYLWLYLVALGGLGGVSFGIGLGWTSWGFHLQAILTGHFRTATSLGAPVLVWQLYRPRVSITL